MSEMKVSFVIVAFNAENVLHYSLESLKQQDYPHKDIEVILIDGLSKDNTHNMMLEFQQREASFSRILVKENPGKILACGWNVALREVTGDIVLRVDAHTRFDPNFISKNVSCIRRGENICGGRVISILQSDTEWNRTLLAAEKSMFGGGFSFFRRGNVPKYTNTLAFASYRKIVFDKVGYYNEKLVRTEDNEMHYRMRNAGYKFFFNPDIISYRFNRSSFKGLLKQKYLNGYWVGLTHGVEPKAFSMSYLVPLFLVFAIILLGFATIWTPLPMLVLVIAYGIVLAGAFIDAIISRGWHISVLAIPVIISALHIGYGMGTIKGLCEEDISMKSSWMSHLYNNKPIGIVSNLVYWLLEIVILPFKSMAWACQLIL